MRTVPGAAMRTPPPSTRVLCPECGEHLTNLPEGTRLALRGQASDGTLQGSCKSCGYEFDLRTTSVGESPRG